MKCAAMSAKTGFVKNNTVTGKMEMYVNSKSMKNFTKICFANVKAQIKLGEAFSETMAVDYVLSRY
jgi:ribosomal protein L20A (L18A)